MTVDPRPNEPIPKQSHERMRRRRLAAFGIGLVAIAPLLALWQAPDDSRPRATPRDDHPRHEGRGRLGPGSQPAAPLIAAESAAVRVACRG